MSLQRPPGETSASAGRSSIGDDLPMVSIVVPTYNRCEVTRTTLRHLVDGDYPADRLEIIVCDNSSDDTPQMARSFGEQTDVAIHVQYSDERLPAVKRNQGLLAARGEFVIFMNDDVWVRPDFARRHVEAHRVAGRPVGVLGHCEQSPRMEHTPFLDWYPPFAYFLLDDQAGQALTYRFSWSMNLSFPRQVMLDQNLLFHEDWAVIGSEDVELGRRWTQAGHDLLYEPRAWGEHYHPHDLDSASRLQESIGRGLRDLEHLVQDPTMLESYGVFTWQNSPKGIVRGLVRRGLFNARTIPVLRRWVDTRERRNRLADWMYPKVLLHSTNRGYTGQAQRRPSARPIVSETARASRTEAQKTTVAA
ncbi:MAG: glycosyltransferase family 2 protein [Acidimicrobiales bacterium]